jgi:PAS domain S-box-containing protein
MGMDVAEQSDGLSMERLQGSWEDFFQHLPFATLICTEEQQIVAANSKAEAQLRAPSSELIGSHFSTLLPTETRAFADTLFSRLRDQAHLSFESALRDKEGTVFPVEIRSIQLGHETPVLIALILRDVGESRMLEQEIMHAYQQLETVIEKRTQQLSQVNEELHGELVLRRKTEEELRRKQEELLAINLQLKEKQVLLVHIEKMASLGQMAASISHEINNPLAYVQSNLQVLQEESAWLKAVFAALVESDLRGSETARTELKSLLKRPHAEAIIQDIPQIIADCQEGAERVQEIISNLKGFVRLESAVQQRACLNAGIESTIKVAGPQIKHRCHVHIDLGELPEIDCAAGQLNQVFMNLIINASQAMEGMGNLYIRSRCVDDVIVLEFEDDGMGMEEEKLAEIFDPFYTTKAPGDGTGLGLAICQQIIQEHEGRIEVVSELGKGSCFSIYLPLERSGDKES